MTVPIGIRLNKLQIKNNELQAEVTHLKKASALEHVRLRKTQAKVERLSGHIADNSMVYEQVKYEVERLKLLVWTAFSEGYHDDDEPDLGVQDKWSHSETRRALEGK